MRRVDATSYSLECQDAGCGGSSERAGAPWTGAAAAGQAPPRGGTDPRRTAGRPGRRLPPALVLDRVPRRGGDPQAVGLARDVGPPADAGAPAGVAAEPGPAPATVGRGRVPGRGRPRGAGDGRLPPGLAVDRLHRQHAVGLARALPCPVRAARGVPPARPGGPTDVRTCCPRRGGRVRGSPGRHDRPPRPPGCRRLGSGSRGRGVRRPAGGAADRAGDGAVHGRRTRAGGRGRGRSARRRRDPDRRRRAFAHRRQPGPALDRHRALREPRRPGRHHRLRPGAARPQARLPVGVADRSDHSAPRRASARPRALGPSAGPVPRG